MTPEHLPGLIISDQKELQHCRGVAVFLCPKLLPFVVVSIFNSQTPALQVPPHCLLAHRTFNNAQLCFRRVTLKSQRVKGLEVVVYCNSAVWAGKTSPHLFGSEQSFSQVLTHARFIREGMEYCYGGKHLKGWRVWWKSLSCATQLDSNKKNADTPEF